MGVCDGGARSAVAMRARAMVLEACYSAELTSTRTRAVSSDLK